MHSTPVTLHELLMRSPDSPPRLQLGRPRSSPAKQPLPQEEKPRFTFRQKIAQERTLTSAQSNSSLRTKSISRQKSSDRRRTLSQVKIMNLTQALDTYKDLRVAQKSNSQFSQASTQTAQMSQ